MLAHNHYERAFAAWLRAWRVPYVAVNEQQRALWDDVSLKSMDFIVSLPESRLLLDVKGRMSNRTAKRSSAENWVTQDDLESLTQWAGSFGNGFTPLLVFTYRQTLPHPHLSCSQIPLEGFHYGFYGIELTRYASALKSRSKRWQTLSLPRDEFRRLRQPIASFLPRSVFAARPEPLSEEGEIIDTLFASSCR